MDGVTLEQNVKGIALAQIARIKTRNLNENLWDSVGFIHDENVKTMDFFEVYTEYSG